MDPSKEILPPSPEPTCDFQLDSLLAAGKCGGGLFVDLELSSSFPNFDDLLTPVSSPADSHEDRPRVDTPTTVASADNLSVQDEEVTTKRRRRKKGSVAKRVSTSKRRRTYERKSVDRRKSWKIKKNKLVLTPANDVSPIDLNDFVFIQEDHFRVTITDDSQADEVVELNIPLHGEDSSEDDDVESCSDDMNKLLAKISASLQQDESRHK